MCCRKPVLFTLVVCVSELTASACHQDLTLRIAPDGRCERVCLRVDRYLLQVGVQVTTLELRNDQFFFCSRTGFGSRQGQDIFLFLETSSFFSPRLKSPGRVIVHSSRSSVGGAVPAVHRNACMGRREQC